MNNVKIDCIISVVDNFGDMGFALELIKALKTTGKNSYKFRVFSDAVEKTRQFLEIHQDYIGTIEVIDSNHIASSNPSQHILSLLHAPIPSFYDNISRIILRIDYLSFDPIWQNMNGKEHIKSNAKNRIYELIPGFTETSSGVIHPPKTSLDRSTWLKDMKLPEVLATKKWVLIFIYEALYERIIWDHEENTVVFMLGQTETKNDTLSNKIFLPLLDIEHYCALLQLSDSMIIRGDNTIVQALFSEKPFFWDIYKTIGGYPQELGLQFLKTFNMNQPYATWHQAINEGTDPLSLKEMIAFLTQEQNEFARKTSRKIPSLVHEIEKYIDREDFSI